MPPPKMKADALNVVVVGAGLGGLAAAIATRLGGHRVTILEQAAQLGEVGAGIQIPPNASNILIKWGMRFKFEKTAMSPSAFKFLRYKDGKVLNTQPMLPYAEETYGSPYWHIHRADYHRNLVEKAKELEIEIVLGARVEHIDFEKPAVKLANGKMVAADLVVGADGLKSKCRELFLGYEDPPRLTGDLAYRIVVDVEEMKKIPELEGLIKEKAISYWMGPDSHVVGYFLKHGALYNIVMTRPDDLPPEVAQQPADLDEMKMLFKSWDPKLRKLLNTVQTTAKWRLQNSEEMESWVHPKGKFVLLGDACHATLPYLAQGAAQAVEDGAVLGGLLSHVTASDKQNLRPLLDAYEALRKKRTTTIVQGSTALQKIFHVHDGPDQEERDRILLEDKPVEGFPNRWRDPIFQRHLFAYDAYGEAEKAWMGKLKGIYGHSQEARL